MSSVAKFILCFAVCLSVGAASKLKCVPVAPAKCSGTFETYTECGSGCGDFKCGDDPGRICPDYCREGCYCNSGYARNQNGKCIPNKECPVVCKAHEEYSECGANGCQNTCANPTLGQVCRAMCMPGCICQDGFLRDGIGECVAEDNCAF